LKAEELVCVSESVQDLKVITYFTVLDPNMGNKRNTKSLRGKTGKRKRSACRQDNDEISSEPDTKLRRKSQTGEGSSSRRRRVAGRRPLRGSAAGERTAEITNGRGHQLEPAGHANDELRRVDEGEQVAGPSSMHNRSDGDSVKCPICSISFTTQEVATPDTCDHTFCATCLQERSQNENNCPVDNNIFNFIHVRHHLGGEIIMRIPVEPPNRQNEGNREDGEGVCCEYYLAHGYNPVFVLAYLAAFYFASRLLEAYFSP
jgi:hypothetical protein